MRPSPSFQVLRKVTDGAAAEVLLVAAARPGPRFLVERLRDEHMHEPKTEEAFRSEVRDRMALGHPHLLQRQQSFLWSSGRPAVLSEPLPGENLAVLLRRLGRLSPDEVVRITAPLCEALDFLHARGRVHGDLRPAHVYIDRLGPGMRPKLFDMGFALLRSPTLQPLQSQPLVPPEYMSPERIRGHRADTRADVYGIGVLMFKMLTGAPPFTSPDPEETRRLVLEGALPALPPSASLLQPILLRCLEREPEARYPTVAAVRQALMNLAGEVTPARPLMNDVTDVRAPLVRPIAEPSPADVGESGARSLGDYELLHPIGEGGMGRVYRARHRSGRFVAVKVLHPELARDARLLERFFLEAERVSAIRHENIVQIQSFGQEPAEKGGAAYLVMELLRGQSLKLLARKKPLPLRRMMDIVRQVALALGAAHRLGVIHLDVKPDNVFITVPPSPAAVKFRRDRVKVLDFGISRLIGQTAADPQGDLARAGLMAMGTPAYMSPEQVEGGSVDARSDVYGVGVLLYWLLSGHTPFAGATVNEVLTAVVRERPPPLPEVTAREEWIPPGLERVVARCLEKRPEDRFQSMEALVEGLAWEPTDSGGGIRN